MDGSDMSWIRKPTTVVCCCLWAMTTLSPSTLKSNDCVECESQAAPATAPAASPRDKVLEQFRRRYAHPEASIDPRSLAALREWVAKHPNDAEAMFHIAITIGFSAAGIKSPEYQRMLRRAAELEFPSAQAILGYTQVIGLVPELRKGEGLDLVRKAAAQNNPDGLWALGVLHLNGNGVAKDNEQAARYLRQA